MATLTTTYLNRAELWLCISLLAYFMMNGAQLFETAVVIPRWTAAPPTSFQLFRGTYGLDFKWFWIVAHSLHEITFVLAIVFCWKIDPARNWLLVLFGLHMAVRVWTLLYFAPNIIAFQQMANAGTYSTDLMQRVQQWKTLNYLRVGLFVAVSLGLIPVLINLLQSRK